MTTPRANAVGKQREATIAWMAKQAARLAARGSGGMAGRVCGGAYCAARRSRTAARACCARSRRAAWSTLASLPSLTR